MSQVEVGGSQVLFQLRRSGLYMWKKSCGFNNCLNIELLVCYFFPESANNNNECWDLNSQRLISEGIRLHSQGLRQKSMAMQAFMHCQ